MKSKPLLNIILICAGISLFSIIFSGLMTITLTDIVVAILIFYAFFINRLMLLGPVFYAILFFAIVSFLSGIVNTITDHTFFTGNFLVNYIRVLGLVGMVLLLPPLQNKIGHNRLAKATLWVLRLHAIFVIADAFFDNPLDWSGGNIVLSERVFDFNRPRGLFIEPSHFGIYAGLSLLYILQVERNRGERYIGVFDIILFAISMIISTSASAVALLLLFLFELSKRGGSFNRAKILFSLFVFSIIVSLSTNRLNQKLGTGINLGYIVEKIGSFRHGIKDENIRVRIFGGWIFSMKIIEEFPLLGVGLGGENQDRILRRMGELHEGKKTSEQIAFGPGSVMPISILIFSGLIGLLPYLYIFYWMVKSSRTRIMGKGLIAICFMWGNAFAPMIWWYICLGISTNNYKKVLSA